MSRKTNTQNSAEGMKKTDNGEIGHLAEKQTKSKKQDNVKSK